MDHQWPPAPSPHELPRGVGPEDHALLRAVQGKAVVKQLGTLPTAVAALVAAVEVLAGEAGTDVEGGGPVMSSFSTAVDRLERGTGTSCSKCPRRLRDRVRRSACRHSFVV